jgi:hypothetical protein
MQKKYKIVQQELHTLPERLNSPPVFSGVRVTRSLVLCVCFVNCCLSFCACAHAQSFLSVQTKYGEPRLYDNMNADNQSLGVSLIVAQDVWDKVLLICCLLAIH